MARIAGIAGASVSVSVTAGSENVFADLGLPNPDERRAKADLVIQIGQLMRQHGLTQERLGKLLGMDQPQISKLLRGRTGGYSIERLARILNHLGQDVRILVEPSGQRSGHLAVETVQEERAAYAPEPGQAGSGPEKT